MKRFDAIVVGAGHNGLTCAAYLGQAGLRVLVLERREVVGGMAETSELLPGVRVPTLAHTVGRLAPRVMRDLKLAAHGLELIAPAVRVFAPRPDPNGGATVLWGDLTWTASGLGPVDRVAYLAADEQIRGWGLALADVMSRAPVDLAAPSLSEAVAALRRGGSSTAADLLRVMPMAVRDLVEDWFESDALQAAIAARGVLLTGLAPRMPGTAGVLLSDLAGNDGGLAGQTVFAKGGPGAVSAALADAVRAARGVIRTGTAVAKVRRAGDTVRGVTLASGEEVDAKVVVSSLDPRTTLLDLIDPEALGPRLGWRAGNIRATGVTAKVNLALSDLPVFPAANGNEQVLQGRILIVPSMRFLDLAMRPAKYGKSAEQPLMELTIPSLVDPTLVAPTGRAKQAKVKHVLSVIVQAVTPGADGIGDVVIKTLDEYAPGLSDMVVASQVISPRDIERDYGASGGHPMHAEVALDQFYAWRPLHGFGRYRLPLRGMYLAGAGAHPGGGVTGLPGRLAAQAALEDRRRRVRRT